MRKTLFWIFAIIITLAAAVYQRKTGPTYPKKVTVGINTKKYTFDLKRNSDNDKDCDIRICIPDSSVTALINYKLYPVEDDWKQAGFVRDSNNLIGYLPKQPAAGKLEYYITLMYKDKPEEVTHTEHVIIRFKNPVPLWALLPHILFMFIAMLLSNLTGIYALFKLEKQKFYGRLTLLFIILGGIIFGPVVQHFAFGQAWTGVPFGWDLTDNKTLIALVFWIIAVVVNSKKQNLRLTILASLVLFVVYIIPHSLLGSEFDYAKGEVVTGVINLIH